MAQQDVRYYLNGMLLETDGKTLRAVATDGHRLALCEAALASKGQDRAAGHRAAQGCAGAAAHPRTRGPRRGDRDQSRSRPDRRHSLHFEADRWPFPGIFAGDSGRSAAAIRADRDVLRQALQRTAILRTRNIAASASPSRRLLTVQAHNPEQEEAEEQIEVGYEGEDLEIGFNVNYLLDALAAIDGQEVEIGLTDATAAV